VSTGPDAARHLKLYANEMSNILISGLVSTSSHSVYRSITDHRRVFADLRKKVPFVHRSGAKKNMASGTPDTCMSLLGADQKGFREAERSMKREEREKEIK
jgi:hypothetical protein